MGGTISLSWGQNGPPPPPPLALSTVSAALIDHGASDRYELLARRAGASVNVVPPAVTVSYDNAKAPGILDAQPPGYWADRYPGRTLSSDPIVVLPDLDASTLGRAALVPQDSHFALNFAHPIVDQLRHFTLEHEVYAQASSTADFSPRFAPAWIKLS